MLSLCQLSYRETWIHLLQNNFTFSRRPRTSIGRTISLGKGRPRFFNFSLKLGLLCHLWSRRQTYRVCLLWRRQRRHRLCRQLQKRLRRQRLGRRKRLWMHRRSSTRCLPISTTLTALTMTTTSATSATRQSVKLSHPKFRVWQVRHLDGFICFIRVFFIGHIQVTAKFTFTQRVFGNCRPNVNYTRFHIPLDKHPVRRAIL